ncbi:hypothetical protein BG005_002768 [Podila minutissima]|nr:hypothetical protein BG005_002768 [Podila minutissima]
MPSHELKGVDGDKVYHGRPKRSTRHILEQSEGFYKRILRQRKQWLDEQMFGTSSFRPWNDLYWWWYFPASFACPHDIQRVGPLSDGGKWICGMSLYTEEPRSKCVIYSFGVNFETRFEGEMLDRTDCEIWAYDASVTQMGPETRGRPGVLFKPYFVGDRDYMDNKGIQWRTLRSLMKENGHDWIDILKVDIEGSEYATFNSIMDDFDVLPFSQLQIELHVDTPHTTFDNFLTWWEKLEAKGLRPFWTEVNLHPAINFATPWASEYCFINIRGEKNILLRDYEIFTLTVVQSPARARMCGFGDRDRRPMDPPPILKLSVTNRDGTEVDVRQLNVSFYIAVADIYDVDRRTARTLVSNPSILPQPEDTSSSKYLGVIMDSDLSVITQSNSTSSTTRNLTGSTVSSGSLLFNTENELGIYFIFPDISVRAEGTFTLKFSFTQLPFQTNPTFDVLATAFSDPFVSYSAKKFPGMTKSTNLSKCFASQGIKIPIRKEKRASRSRVEEHVGDGSSPKVLNISSRFVTNDGQDSSGSEDDEDELQST